MLRDPVEAPPGRQRFGRWQAGIRSSLPRRSNHFRSAALESGVARTDPLRLRPLCRLQARLPPLQSRIGLLARFLRLAIRI